MLLVHVDCGLLAVRIWVFTLAAVMNKLACYHLFSVWIWDAIVM
jgi:hypothetical protein